jgi:hypothetical protein
MLSQHRDKRQADSLAKDECFVYVRVRGCALRARHGRSPVMFLATGPTAGTPAGR